MKYVLPVLFLLTLTQTLLAQSVNKEESRSTKDSIKIDRIEISGNWITWDLIIKNELSFEEGDWISIGEIDTSMNKIWNIENFANVEYTIEETLEINTLKIEALDAVKFYPLFTIDHSSENDYNYRIGAGDDNFLGSNTKLKMTWEKNPHGVKWDFKIGLPRQLLYKNMTTEFGFTKGTETKIFLDKIITSAAGETNVEYQTLMLAPFNKTEFYINIGNPWHLDYQYRFSPNLSLSWYKHEINHKLLSEEDLELGVHVPKQKYNFLDIKISESIGTVNKKRHRKDGYTAQLSYDLNYGLQNTNSFHAFNAEGEYHKILSDIVQLSTQVNTGYNSADDQYKFIKGSADVLGIRKGEIYGKTFYAAYAGAHLTWLNTKWISLENAYFVNFGNGADTYSELFHKGTNSALGSFIEIRFPIAPIVAFRFTFMYAGPGSEWYKFNIE